MKNHLQDPFSGKHSRMPRRNLFVLSLKSQGKMAKKVANCKHSQMQNTVLEASFLLFFSVSYFIQCFHTNYTSYNFFNHCIIIFSFLSFWTVLPIQEIHQQVKVNKNVCWNNTSQLWHAPKDPVQMRLWTVCVGEPETVHSLTSSQVIHMLLVLGTHFEQQGVRRWRSWFLFGQPN